MKPTLTPRQAELLKSLPREGVYFVNTSITRMQNWNALWTHGLSEVVGLRGWRLTPAGRALWDELNKEKRQ